jgi:hypothetical protein
LAGEMSIVNVGLVAAIALMAIAILWLTNSAIGELLNTPSWLLILGVIGFLSIVAFQKHREN